MNKWGRSKIYKRLTTAGAELAIVNFTPTPFIFKLHLTTVTLTDNSCGQKE